MNVGDKVRMLRGKEEGIVTKIIDQKLIEIEIEDGFQIPVLKTEVVPVAREEASYFKREAAEPQAAVAAPAVKKKGPTQEGHFVAFKPLNDRILSVHLINNTDDIILYSILEEIDGMYKSVLSGHLKARQAHKFTQTDMHQFEQWPIWHVRILLHPENTVSELPVPIHQRLHPKASSFFRSMRETPILNSKSYLIPLSAASRLASTTAENLQNKMDDQREEVQQPDKPQRTPAEVDLHLDKLVDDPKSVAEKDILQLQLETFERTLDRAMASGLDEITFVHGVGNGTLRKEIHRRLGNLNTIAWFKDAQKEKWGYGATLVRLK
ncbi:Smr domain-containing protein [Flammeovirgaceae bacterium 311]|nr:Smr domain-containing protein [Flammeovirgaceae bacterium 311]